MIYFFCTLITNILIQFIMKKIIIITLIVLNLILSIHTTAKNKKLILNDIIIIIDVGHGSKDIGTSYKNVYEKDINLNISKKLKIELENFGANVILTRDGDYDLSTPNTNTRKRSDFNNRIKLINEYNPNLVISIHQNYYKDSRYSGTQIFYKGNKELAKYLQKNINKKRLSKPISSSLYMYNKIKADTLLIECGFLSNATDRKNLTNETYQANYSKDLAKYIAEYFKKN